MNMWGEGRAYGYIRFKKSVPTENMGVDGAACPGHGSAPCADVVITINNRNSSKQKARFIPLVVCACRGRSGRPAVGCMLCVGESMHLLEQSADSGSSSLPL